VIRSLIRSSFLFLLCLAAFGRYSLALAPAGVSPTKVRAYWKALNLIGFRGVGLVAENGRTIFFEASDDVAPRATFDIASIAKSITAVAVLRLAQQGKLKLDDPLSRFFPDAPADKRVITVHQLLTHTGGLGNPTGDTAEGVKDRAKAVRMILATPLVETPGMVSSYSNDGYTLLAAIMEVATSKSWEQVIREEILGPAGMTHTLFLGDRLPEGEAAPARSKVAARKTVAWRPHWGSKGGAGILSTAEDLKRFITASADDTLLDTEGTKELGKSYASAGEIHQYSRVFDLREVPGAGPVWSHGGADSDDGHYSVIEYYPARRVLIILLALDDEIMKNIVETGFRRTVLDEGSGETPPDRPGHPATDLHGMTLVGDGLHFTIQGDSPATLLPGNPAATAFLVARSREDRQQIDQCVTLTKDLLRDVQNLSDTAAPLSTDHVGSFIKFWRDGNRNDGPVEEVTVLGATPNWVDNLGGTLSFVRVKRPKRTTVFRLYWTGGKLQARGGSVFPNPAPMPLIAFGKGRYGAWNPALGKYADLSFAASKGRASQQATLVAGNRSVTLRGSASLLR
jgi:CubicO group peptidase (beta-lactamase class C family)